MSDVVYVRGGLIPTVFGNQILPIVATLLDGETDGFAVDFEDFASQVQVRTGGVDAFFDVDAFFTYVGDPKYVKTTATTLGALTFPISFGQGLLIEPAATNMISRSETFATWDTLTNCTVTSNSTVAPDLNTTADTITVTAPGAANTNIQAGAAGSANVPYVASCFLKAGVEDWAAITSTDNATQDAFAFFDLVNGTVGTTGNTGAGIFIGAGIENIGSGWFRCYVSSQLTTTTKGMGVFVAESDGDATCGAGDTVIAWGAQLELGSVPTSYIPTVAAAVTRATDVVSVALTDFPFSATDGTFIVWALPRIANNAASVRLLAAEASTNEYMMIAAATVDTPDGVGFQVVDGGATQVDAAVTRVSGFDIVDGNKAAAAYAANNFGIVLDGSAEVTDVTGTLPTVTTLYLGTSVAFTPRELNGFIRRVIYVPRRMTEAEMQGHT